MEEILNSGSVLPPRKRLSEELDALFEEIGEEATTLGELSSRLQGREIGVLLLVAGLPFLIPMPTPGLSTPFGLALAMLGLSYAFRADFRLPPLLQKHALSPKTVQVIRRCLVGFCRRLEWLIQNRLPILDRPFGRALIGVAIISASLALAVPGPGSNVVPAMSLTSLALGILGRDGILLVFGTILSGASWLYVLFIGYLVIHLGRWLQMLWNSF